MRAGERIGGLRNNGPKKRAMMREMNSERARQGLAVYFFALLLGSAYLEWRIIQLGASIEKAPWLILALMYMPAVASIAARLACREGFGDVAFRLGGREGRR